MNNSIIKYPVLIAILVQEFTHKYPDTFIGKTMVQKFMYFFSREETVPFEFTMYHYGPYSSRLSGDLQYAKTLGLINIVWKETKGFMISPTSKAHSHESLITAKEKQIIKKIIDKYGIFNTVQLSIIATAMYIESRFNVTSKEDLVNVVQRMKQKERTFITNTLQHAGIIESA